MIRGSVIILVLLATAIGVTLGFSKMAADDSDQKHEEEDPNEQKIVVTSPKIEDVTITESFVCQIRSQRHIEVRALEGGYLEEISDQGGPGGEEGRRDVQDPARSLQGKAGRREGRRPASRN